MRADFVSFLRVLDTASQRIEKPESLRCSADPTVEDQPHQNHRQAIAKLRQDKGTTREDTAPRTSWPQHPAGCSKTAIDAGGTCAVPSLANTAEKNGGVVLLPQEARTNSHSSELQTSLALVGDIPATLSTDLEEFPA